MNGIKGIGASYNNLNFTSFGFKKHKGNNDVEKFIFLDQHLLDYGIPEKVAFVRDHEYEFTTAMLFDKNNECFYSEEMPDDEALDAKRLFRQNGVKEFVYLEDIKGGQYGKAKKNRSEIHLINSELLSPADSFAVLKALYELEKNEQAAKTYLESPVILKNPELGYSMGYYSFLAETANTGFEIDDVLNNLNISTKKSFLPKKIDKITVSPDGFLMRITTKDGKKAALDFKSGKRTVYDSNGAFGDETIVIMDKNGPIIRKSQDTCKVN